jgi:hypothetical protein
MHYSRKLRAIILAAFTGAAVLVIAVSLSSSSAQDTESSAYSSVPQQSSAPAANVILITIDGLRWQEVFTGADPVLIANKYFVQDVNALGKEFWHDNPAWRREKLMPFMWTTVKEQGRIYGNRNLGNKMNVSNSYWFSYPGYNEILTGHADDRLNNNDKVNNPNKTVLEFINHQKGFKNKVAAFGSWDVFPFIINEQRSGVPVNAGFETATDSVLTEKEKFLNQMQGSVHSPWKNVRLDAFTQNYALEYMKRNKPRVLYIAYGETDDFAHDGRYDFYLEAARRTDSFIKEVWDYIQSDDFYKDRTTMIITTDHGRGTMPVENWRHHGKQFENSDQTWLAAIGKGITPAGEIKKGQQHYQHQVAQTLARLIGLNFTSEKKPGPPMEDLFAE